MHESKFQYPICYDYLTDSTTPTATSVCHPWSNATGWNHAAEDDAAAAVESNEYAAAATAATTTVRPHVKRTSWLTFLCCYPSSSNH